jgi:WD40 repeat protein
MNARSLTFLGAVLFAAAGVAFSGDADSSAPTAVVTDLDSGPGALTVSPDGKSLAVMDGGGCIRICDLASGKSLKALKRQQRDLQILGFVGRDPDALASMEQFRESVGGKCALRVWSVSAGVARLEIDATRADTAAGSKDHSVQTAAISPVTHEVACAYADHRVCVIETTGGRLQGAVLGADSERRVDSLAFSPDAMSLAVLLSPSKERKSTIVVFARQSEKSPWKKSTSFDDAAIADHPAGVWTQLAFTRDGKSLVGEGVHDESGPINSVRSRSVLRRWDLPAGDVKWTVLSDERTSRRVSISPRADEIVVGGTSDVQLVDTGTGSTIRTLPAWRDILCGIAMSPDGRYVYATMFKTGIVVRWDLGPGK